MFEIAPALHGQLALGVGAVVAALAFWGLSRPEPFHPSLVVGLVATVVGSWLLHAPADQIGFLAMAYVLVVLAVKVVTAKAAMHATFWLALTLLGVAVVYLTVGAQVLAAVQILIYVGAVVTLILFTVIMTTPEVEAEEERAMTQPVLEETHTGAPPRPRESMEAGP